MITFVRYVHIFVFAGVIGLEYGVSDVDGEDQKIGGLMMHNHEAGTIPPEHQRYATRLANWQ